MHTLVPYLVTTLLEQQSQLVSLISNFLLLINALLAVKILKYAFAQKTWRSPSSRSSLKRKLLSSTLNQPLFKSLDFKQKLLNTSKHQSLRSTSKLQLSRSNIRMLSMNITKISLKKNTKPSYMSITNQLSTKYINQLFMKSTFMKFINQSSTKKNKKLLSRRIRNLFTNLKQILLMKNKEALRYMNSKKKQSLHKPKSRSQSSPTRRKIQFWSRKRRILF